MFAIPVWDDLRPGQASPYNTLPWLTIALIATGIIYALVLARLRPGCWSRPGPARDVHGVLGYHLPEVAI